MAIHSNPGSLMSSKSFKESAPWPPNSPDSIQVRRAAQCIKATLDFLRAIETEMLDPDEFKGMPLDMHSYTMMFGTTRSPMRFRDVWVRAPSSRHIAVLRGGEFFKVEVMDAKRNPHSAITIARQLEVVTRNRESQDVPNLAALTTLDRDIWADAYVDLKSSSRSALDAIGGALFHVALDDEAETKQKRNDIVRSFLHGSGSNRWFDQSFTLIVDENGNCGSNFEHSWGDGLSMVRWANVIHDSISKWQPSDFGEDSKMKSSAVSKIKFGQVSPSVLITRDTALDRFEKLKSSLKLETRIFSNYGTDHMKKLRASSDAGFQQALQLAYRRMTGKTVATYESCSTQTFLGGRTETIRSASNESAAFVSEMTDCLSEGDATRARLLRKALEKHSRLANEAATGSGFDRHLFAIKQLALSKNLPLPDLLKGKGYALLEKNIISTSTVSQKYADQAAFGPVVSNGVGVCYHFFPDRIHFCVTSYELDPIEFCDKVEEALKDIERLLQIFP